MSARLYIEGGGDSKDLRTRCRKAFRRLLEKCRFSGRMPRLVACGGRSAAFDDFQIAHDSAQGDYVAMLVDSEDPVADIERTWAHLKLRDGWSKPSGADDENVLLMVTCTETWIATDRHALRIHYGADLQESALPALFNMEARDRHLVQKALRHATRDCRNAYAKGKRSFDVLAELNPDELRQHLPSFERCERILGARL